MARTTYNTEALTAGDMQWRITLQRASNSVDAFNNRSKAWLNLATVWASWEELSDSERIAAQGKEADITTRFQIRLSPKVADINPKDRILFKGKTYDISAVKKIGRNVGLEISASARTDQ